MVCTTCFFTDNTKKKNRLLSISIVLQVVISADTQPTWLSLLQSWFQLLHLSSMQNFNFANKQRNGPLSRYTVYMQFLHMNVWYSGNFIGSVHAQNFQQVYLHRWPLKLLVLQVSNLSLLEKFANNRKVLFKTFSVSLEWTESIFHSYHLLKTIKVKWLSKD